MPAWRETFRRMNASERRLYAVLLDLGTRVIPQVQIGPWTVDFFLPDLDVAVEADSRLYHTWWEDARADRLRDEDLRARGVIVVHIWSDNLYAPGGTDKVMRHVRLRVYRGRRVWLSGPGSRRQFQRLPSIGPEPPTGPTIRGGGP